ncbi:MAG: hypothetical protein Q9187_003482 [Circinaria calcarea]
MLNEPLLELLWGVMAEVTTTLRDLIMQISSETSTTQKLPSIQTRRAACTHMILTRFYGAHKCSHCNRPSWLGWVYRCVQDDERQLPESPEQLADEDGLGIITVNYGNEADTDKVLDDASGEVKPGQVKEMRVVQLSPWMERAILDGHYTTNQVIQLRAQKQKVNDVIAAADGNNTLQHTLFYQSNPSTKSTLPCEQTRTSSTTEETLDGISLVDRPPAPPKLIPICYYKTCQVCRPTSRDRAWQCFEHIFNNSEPPSAIDFSSDNRPVSDANLVRGIGLRKKRPHLRHLGIFNDILAPSDEGSRTLTEESSNQADADWMSRQVGQLRSRDFRNHVRRVWEQILFTRRRESRASSRSSRRVQGAQEDGEDSDLGVWRDWNSSGLLGQATRTKLPGQDGTDGLDVESGGGEVIVDNGIAVTEEAVDLRSADIIMSV